MPVLPQSPPEAVIFTIGDELLSGDVLDTNAAFLARACRGIGLRVRQIQSRGDDLEEIRTGLGQVLAGAAVCLVSGGLGPTSDDRTTEAVAGFFGLPLQRDPVALQAIAARFAAWGRSMPSINEKQADFPQGAERLDNSQGTAPGFCLDLPDRGGLLFAMPGVPRELQTMWREQVEPRLRQRFALVPPSRRTYRMLGMGESAIASKIEPAILAQAPVGLRIHYRARAPEVLLTLEAPGVDLAAFDSIVKSELGPVVYGIGEAELPERLLRALVAAKLRIAVAESCTAGGCAAALGAVAGASACLRGAIVAYDNEIKVDPLGVSRELLQAHGAVSEQTAEAMAKAALRALRSDLALGITGIAGPTGATAEKPLGTVKIAVSDAQYTRTISLRLPGDRGTVQRSAALWALKLAWDHLCERGLAHLEALD